MDAQAARSASTMMSFNLEACNATSLRRASRAVSRYYDDHLAASGVTMAQFTLLATAAKNPGLPTNRLRKLLSLDRSNYSRSLKRLLNEDLVQLVLNDADRRYRIVELTEKGHRSLGAANRLWSKAQMGFIELVGGAAAAELRAAANSLERLFD